MSTIIDLYEDNAGGLSLLATYDDGRAPVRYAGFEYLLDVIEPATFRADAEALAAGADDPTWTLERYEGDEAIDTEAGGIGIWTGDLIATYQDGVITLHHKPGAAGRRYLGSDEPTAPNSYRPHTIAVGNRNCLHCGMTTATLTALFCCADCEMEYTTGAALA